MNSIGRRIERLEQKLKINRGPRVIVCTINPNRLPEDPYTMKLSPRGDMWAYAVRGGPFTEEEKRALRKEYEGNQ